MGSDYRSGTSLSYANHTDPILTAPPGIVNGDVLGLLFEIGGNPSPPTPTPPSGFTIAAGYPLTRSDSNGFTVKTYLWTKPANNESGDYQVLHSSAVSTGFLGVVLGADVANPLTPAPTTQTGLGTTSTAPTLTTTLDQTLIWYWVGRWNFPGGTFDAGGTTPSFTLRNDAANSLLWVGTGVLSPQGATGNKTATGLPQAGDEPWSSGLIAFKPAAAGAVQQLAGISAGRSTAQGSLSVVRSLNGRTMGQSNTVGTVSVIRGLAARVAGSSSAQGAFNAIRGLAGKVAGSSTAQGAMNLFLRLAGIAQGFSRAMGALFLSSELLNPLSIDDATIDDATWEDFQVVDKATWEDFRIIDLPEFSMTVEQDLNPIAKGDARTVRRRFRNLPTGATITKAWLTVKRSDRDDDVDALISKEITASPSVQGQIIDANTDDGQIEVSFEITAAETNQAAIKPDVAYPFDIQILRSTGQPHTFMKGRVPFFRDVTRKDS